MLKWTAKKKQSNSLWRRKSLHSCLLCSWWQSCAPPPSRPASPRLRTSVRLLAWCRTLSKGPIYDGISWVSSEWLLLCLIGRNHHHCFNLLLLLLHFQGHRFCPTHLQGHQDAATDRLHISTAATVGLSLGLPASILLAGKGVWSVRSLVPTSLLLLHHSMPRQASLVLLAGRVEGAKQWGGAGVSGRRRRRERDEWLY